MVFSMNPSLLSVATVASQMKWSGFCMGCITLLVLFIVNSFSLLQFVANSTPLLAGAALLELFSVSVMVKKSADLQETHGGGDPPDLWFGIPPEKLHEYFETIGSEGRNAYLGLNSWDFMPYMPAYTILLGALLVRQCQTADIPRIIAWIFPGVMICDVIESYLLGYEAKYFPERLNPKLVGVASVANQMKWSGFCSGCLILLALFSFNSFSSKTPNAEGKIQRQKLPKMF